MLVPDWIYSRIPLIWLSLMSAICLSRALYIYQCRRKFHRRNRIAFLNETQVIDRNRR
jgi:hypothetical protein